MKNSCKLPDCYPVSLPELINNFENFENRPYFELGPDLRAIARGDVNQGAVRIYMPRF